MKQTQLSNYSFIEFRIFSISFSLFLKFWNRIDELSSKQELNDLKKLYHDQFLTSLWNIFIDIYVIFAGIIQIIILIYQDLVKEIQIIKFMPIIVIIKNIS